MIYLRNYINCFESSLLQKSFFSFLLGVNNLISNTLTVSRILNNQKLQKMSQITFFERHLFKEFLLNTKMYFSLIFNSNFIDFLPQLSVSALKLFETMIGLCNRQIMYNLIFRNFIPRYHLLDSEGDIMDSETIHNNIAR